ncbi:MAG TPA: RodZ domain-containing protein [Sideroxyarcus sp.]|nr:RodZ domain-containing protein [Sideroxyarcus sp.]
MDESAASANNPEPSQAVMSVGATLRQERERMGLSVADIANRIKFAPKQVEALEADDVEHLPQGPFLRGFVRSYARALQLDEVALVAALPVDPSQQPVVREKKVDVPFPTAQSLRRINVMWLAGALGVALVLGLFVWLSDSEPTAKPIEMVVEPVALPASAVAASEVVATEGTELPPVKEVEPVKPAEPKKADEVKKVTEPKKVAEPKPSVAQPLPQIEAASAPVAVKTPLPLEILKRRPLHFVFSKDAWAEVIDVNGVILLSRTNPAGSEQWIGGPKRAPYDVTIAHPASVKLYYKGKEIDLSPYAAMDTARLKVE